MHKTRTAPGEIGSLTLWGDDITGHTAVLVDDIVDTAGYEEWVYIGCLVNQLSIAGHYVLLREL